MSDQDKMSRLNVACRQKDKGLWVNAAKSSGKNLEQWINDTLNASAKRADVSPPSWMRCFSKPTTSALMAAQIYKSSELVERVEEDSLFNIDGFDSNCVDEVKSWHTKSSSA